MATTVGIPTPFCDLNERQQLDVTMRGRRAERLSVGCCRVHGLTRTVWSVSATDTSAAAHRARSPYADPKAE